MTSHHYERVILPHIVSAEAALKRYHRSLPLADVLFDLAMRERIYQAPALLSLWAGDSRPSSRPGAGPSSVSSTQKTRRDGSNASDQTDTAPGEPGHFSRWLARRGGDEIYRTTAGLAHRVGSGERAHGEALSQAMVAWQSCRFRQHGRHTLVASPGLAQRLMLTELRGLKGADLRLPYPTLYIEVPQELGFKTWNNQTGWHPVIGVYVSDDEIEKTGRGFRLLICAAGVSTDPRLADYDDALSHFFLPLPDDASMDEILSDFVRALTSNWSTTDRVSRNLPVEDKRLTVMVDEWVSIFRWIVNVLFYATSPDCERTDIEANDEARKLWARIQKMPKARGNKKRARLLDEYRATPRQPRTILGHTIEIDRSLPLSSAEAQAVQRGPLRVRTLVAGHFQRYAVGPQRTERVWKWRAPFWRGPKDGDVATNTTHKAGRDE